MGALGYTERGGEGSGDDGAKDGREAAPGGRCPLTTRGSWGMPHVGMSPPPRTTVAQWLRSQMPGTEPWFTPHPLPFQMGDPERRHPPLCVPVPLSGSGGARNTPSVTGWRSHWGRVWPAVGQGSTRSLGKRLTGVSIDPSGVWGGRTSPTRTAGSVFDGEADRSLLEQFEPD